MSNSTQAYAISGRRGLMLVISSPSGAGKTSLSRRLVADHDSLDLSISCTTRAPRPGEKDGREYHFVSQERFEALIAEDAFLEWADVHDNRYGTLKAPVYEALDRGDDILFDIDWQGARQITERSSEAVVKVFILPPSLHALKRRLEARAQDEADVIARRLARAKGEIEHYGEYDYVIVNDDFDRAYAQLAHIFHAEQLKLARNPGVDGFVERLLVEETP
jgi:guanylate kinase